MTSRRARKSFTIPFRNASASHANSENVRHLLGNIWCTARASMSLNLWGERTIESHFSSELNDEAARNEDPVGIELERSSDVATRAPHPSSLEHIRRSR